MGSVVQINLQKLNPEAGAALLHSLVSDRSGRTSIPPDDPELLAASDEVDGHALTLSLLGTFIARAYRGDIRRRSEVKFDKADAVVLGGHTFRMMATYENWLAQSGETGARQLAVLRLLGLFDRPAESGCFSVLRRAPAIPKLTEPLISLGDKEWNLTISELEAIGLVTVWTEEPMRITGFDEAQARTIIQFAKSLQTIPIGKAREFNKLPDAILIDVHPLVRQYFGGWLRD